MAKLIPANLNPPILLWLLNPLSHLNYYTALGLWSALSLILGLVGAGIGFSYAFPRAFLRRNGFYLYLIYLSFFATLMNTALGQLGSLLLFLIMSGYHYYMKKNDYAAGVLWGIIISIKLFPALLFVYVVLQKRYKVSMVMLSTFLLMALIPMFVYGNIIYTQYFSMMSQVLWYGKSWNGSIFGFVFRVFSDGTNSGQNLLFVNGLYITLFCITAIFYLVKMIEIEKMKIVHQSFCLSLVVMLLLSPFGWLYYFTILTFPFALTWNHAVQSNRSLLFAKPAWFLCLCCLNVPINNIPLGLMKSMIDKLSIYSLNFYGLLLLLYMTSQMTTNVKHLQSFNK